MKNIPYRRSIFLPFILASFFFFMSFVRAEEVNYIVSDRTISLINDIDIDKAISTADSIIDSSYPYYLILYMNYNNSFGYYLLLYSSPRIFNTSNNRISISGNRFYSYSSDFNSLTSLGSFSQSFINIDSSYYSSVARVLIYSNHNIVFKDINYNTYSFIYIDKVYSFLNNTTINFPTLYDLYSYFISPISVPSDITPILTNFYTTIINKISYLSEEFSNSYIYLSIVGIFIIIFLIELIRRKFI